MRDSKKKNRGNEGFLRKNYSLSWKYIKESLVYIYFIIFLLSFGFFIGLIFQPDLIVDYIKAFMETILLDTANLNVFELIIYILNNNLKNSFFSMFLGIIFGVMPVFTALINGYVLGFVCEKSVMVAGPLILFRLVPHGIFEFPAIILALATGVKLSRYQFFSGIRDKWKSFLAFMISFFVFLALFFILSGLVTVIFSPGILSGDLQSNLLEKPSFSYSLQLFSLIAAICSYIFSNLIGNLVFDKQERVLVKKEFIRVLEGSLRVFLFVVLPLLILAAIIEGFLIILI